jgi:ribose transport system ATP-binding protein
VSEPLLRVEGVRKVFGGAVALADADLTVHPREIRGLIGENGAGKSTLIKILAGAVSPDGGMIAVGGSSVTSIPDPHAARELGMAFIHQDLGLVADQSVAENVAMAVGYAKRGPVINWRATRRQASDALATMGIDLDPDMLVGELPIAARSAVAIARALASNARILFLDEPTASLAAGEVSALFQVLRNLRERGLGIVFVSHRMDEVRSLCDAITVLRDGRTVGATAVSEVTDREIVAMIVGREVHAADRLASPASETAPRLVATQLRGETLGPITFTAHAGEILGFTGLSDAGHHEIGPILFGVRRATTGTVELDGEPYRPRSVPAALDAGVAFVPEDRAADGLGSSLTLRENLFSNPTVPPWRFVRPGRERLEARSFLTEFDVRPSEPDRETSTLSGGNAQKLLIAKWFARRPRLIVLNEPTTGVDIGAREDIHRLIREQAKSGMTVLVMSSDFEEVAVLCDRVLVLRRGLLQDELSGEALEADSITATAMSSAR